MAIRIAATGDSHFDLSSRWDECRRIHNWIADDMTARNVDLFLHCGDWFERGSKIGERNAVREWLQRVAGERPVIGVKGNHDSLGDLDVFNHVRAQCPIIIEESANVHVIEIPDADADIPFGTTPVAVASIAWLQKAVLLSMLDREVSYEESEAECRRLLKVMMLGIRDQLAAHDGPRILIVHSMISGSKTSSGQPLVGCDLEVSIEDLAIAEPDLILMGHIHKPQEWTSASGIPVIYCGSPYATAYGETEPKSYVLAEFAESRSAGSPLIRVERIETPRTPMVLLEANFNPATNAFEAEIPEDLKGADVRFRYHFDSEHQSAAADAGQRFEQQFNIAGAAAVKVEGVKNATSRARAPEIVQATDIGSKLPVLWKVKGTEPEPDRAARLVSMAGELERERLAAS